MGKWRDSLEINKCWKVVVVVDERKLQDSGGALVSVVEPRLLEDRGPSLRSRERGNQSACHRRRHRSKCD